MSIFHSKNSNICHLELEIALGVRTSNDWKIETNNSAAQGLMFINPSPELWLMNYTDAIVSALLPDPLKSYFKVDPRTEGVNMWNMIYIVT